MGKEHSANTQFNFNERQIAHNASVRIDAKEQKLDEELIELENQIAELTK